MELHEMIGFIAGFGTTFAAAPDLLAMLRRRNSQGMNPTMAGIMGTWPTVVCGLTVSPSCHGIPCRPRNSETYNECRH